MNKKMTYAIAIMAIVAMVFAGIAAAQTAGQSSSSVLNAPAQAIPGTSSEKAISSATAPATSQENAINSHVLVEGREPALFLNNNIVSIVGVTPIGEESVTFANLGDKTVTINGASLNLDSGAFFALPTLSLNPGEKEEFKLFNAAGAPANVLNDFEGAISLIDSNGILMSKLEYENAPMGSALAQTGANAD